MKWESADQAAVVAWAKGSSKRWPALGLLYAIPNGHGVHVAIRLQMLREGLLPGVPDLCLPVPFMGYHSLYVEMKHGDNKLSPAQKTVCEMLEGLGHKVCVAYGHVEAVEIITAYVERLPIPKKYSLRIHL